MITRRAFVKDGSVALLSLGLMPRFLGRTALAAESRRQKLLVAIFQRGAVDGLNMIVPYGESAYYSARPSIAVERPGRGDGAIDLDGFFGFHPRLAPLLPWWQSRHLAIVHACGSPDVTRSHFDAQDYMESGTPGVKSTGDGWLNRVLAQSAPARPDPSPFRAVALAPTLPRSLQGPAPALAIAQLSRFGLRGADRDPSVGASFEAEYAAAADQVLTGTGHETFEAVRMLKAADPARYAPAHGAEYPASAFGQALRQVAQLAKADVGLEVAFAEIGQWDHHVAEGGAVGQLATRLADFGAALSALATDLGPRLDDTVVVTMSEFGRALTENGARGTDHGHGNAMMIMGGPVRGGRVYGRWPGLGRDLLYEGRDLQVTTDFRSVFTEIASVHLGVANANLVFPGFVPPPGSRLGIIA